MGTPMNHQENHQNRGIPAGGLPTDLRREDPLMGFSGSNKGSNGSGGIPNPHIQHHENEKELFKNHPSYRHNKQKNDERNALSQDWGVEMQQMEVANNAFADRKGSANPNILDNTIPNVSRNRNFNQKVCWYSLTL